jgi:hypothetical protein
VYAEKYHRDNTLLTEFSICGQDNNIKKNKNLKKNCKSEIIPYLCRIKNKFKNKLL